MKVVVTGSSGKAGRAVVAELLEHGQDVLGVDVAAPPERLDTFVTADVTDFGRTVECLAGADAVVHVAAIPAPGLRSAQTTFRTNIVSTFNVFEAARVLGLERVVRASSETILDEERAELPARPRRRRPRGALHRRGARHRDGPDEPRPHGRGLP